MQLSIDFGLVMVLIGLIFTPVFSSCPREEIGFRLARYYQNNMVLQREPYNAVIWGYASGSDATVTISLLGRKYATRPATTGNSTVRRIKLDPIKAYNKLLNVTISQTSGSGVVNSLQLTNVLFGDVWLFVLFAFPIFPTLVKNKYLNIGAAARATWIWN
jgi:hypothetical protein